MISGKQIRNFDNWPLNRGRPFNTVPLLLVWLNLLIRLSVYSLVYLNYSGTPFQIVGVVQLVYREKDGEILALADHRKGGGPAGYRWPIEHAYVKGLDLQQVQPS